MTFLDDERLIEAYKREVAVPGDFASAFPNTTDEDIAGMLADGFAAAQLHGFFATHSIDPIVNEVTPDLTPAGEALIIIFAGVRTLRAGVRSMGTGTRYKAGPVEYEVSQSSSALTELLRGAEARLAALLLAAQEAAYTGTTTFVMDGYAGRVFSQAELPAIVPVHL